MVEAWIITHKEELITLWNIMQEGEGYFKIDPLKGNNNEKLYNTRYNRSRIKR